MPALNEINIGNHDRALDLSHDAHDSEIFDLFTSPEAKSSGIHYLNDETRTIFLPGSEPQRAIKVYGNPKQPDFLNSTYAFTYKPHPSPEAAVAWESSPRTPEQASIWVMHDPPNDRLDYINIPEYPGLQGCVAQAQRIAEAKPLLCVFGHYHVSNGVERVRWKSDGNGIEEAKVLTKPRNESAKYDFSSNGADGVLNVGRETVFVNAAWRPGRDKRVKERNNPAVITLDLPVFQDS